MVGLQLAGRGPAGRPPIPAGSNRAPTADAAVGGAHRVAATHRVSRAPSRAQTHASSTVCRFQMMSVRTNAHRSQRDMVAGPDSRVDFAMAEALAFGTLLLHQGVTPPGVALEPGVQEAYFDPTLGLNKGHYSVRLTGQDVARGTFGQRHAAAVDTVTGQWYATSSQSSAVGNTLGMPPGISRSTTLRLGTKTRCMCSTPACVRPRWRGLSMATHLPDQGPSPCGKRACIILMNRSYFYVAATFQYTGNLAILPTTHRQSSTRLLPLVGPTTHMCL